MPRSRSPSPYAKSRSSDKSSRTLKSSSSRKRSPIDNSRSVARSSRRSRSPTSKAHKSRQHSPSDRTRSRRSRSTSPRRRRSPSKSKKSSRNYSSSNSRRRSRSRDSCYRNKSSKSRRRHESSSTSSTSSSDSSSSSSRSSRSRSKSPVQRSTKSSKDQYIPLTKGFIRKTQIKRIPFGIRPDLTKSMFKLSLEHTKTKRIQSPARTTFASVDQLLEDPIMPETLDKINADEFVSRSFSSKKIASEKVIIDLDKETVVVPKAIPMEEDDPFFFPNLYADDSTRMDKWVKKLFIYRQKAFLGN